LRFLVDINLSPRLADQLGALGHDVVHAWSLGLGSAPDAVLLERVRSENRVLMSADSDFGTILAATRATTPSVLYLRGVSGRRVDDLVARVVTALPAIQEALTAGSLVVVEPAIVRIPSLPIL
jgi:predicted nuclease of predicted toxin-antitoxin system